MASSHASTPEQFSPQSSHGTPTQFLQKAVQAKPVTGVVKPEVSLSGGSIVGKPSRGHVTQVIKAQPLDIVHGPETIGPWEVLMLSSPLLSPLEIRSQPHLGIRVTCHLVPIPSKALPARVNPHHHPMALRLGPRWWTCPPPVQDPYPIPLGPQMGPKFQPQPQRKTPWII